MALLEWILQKDRFKRPTLNQVLVKVEELMIKASARELELAASAGDDSGDDIGDDN